MRSCSIIYNSRGRGNHLCLPPSLKKHCITCLLLVHSTRSHPSVSGFMGMHCLLRMLICSNHTQPLYSYQLATTPQPNDPQGSVKNIVQPRVYIIDRGHRYPGIYIHSWEQRTLPPPSTLFTHIKLQVEYGGCIPTTKPTQHAHTQAYHRDNSP